ncbi:MAG: cobalamin-dependent protein [Chloroflexota bacterium]|nr:cobalamin-dependent protein [Chloroflexota bacterium]
MDGHEVTTPIPIGQVVAELQRAYPEVTHSSLRFLEREGLVTPTRTPGGHRLYFQHDLDRVRRIKDWQAQRLSLEEIRQRLVALRDVGPPAVIASRFLDEALRGDLAAATQTILRADELGMSLVHLFDDVLRPALYEVGKRWERGDLSVAQEKEISELARDLIAELARRHADPDPRGPTAVAAGVAGERHDLGLRMVAALLRARGWRVHFLGADVAPSFLVEAVQLRAPAVVLLSATTEERLSAVEEAIAALHAGGEDAAVPVVVGGGQVVAAHAATFLAWGVVAAVDDSLAAVLDVLSPEEHRPEATH